jgi:Kef-type K+ transport system membrane component KefB
MTEWLGIHLLFGAFLFGAIMPGHLESWIADRGNQ